MGCRLLGLRTGLLPLKAFELETFSRVGIGLDTLWLRGWWVVRNATCQYAFIM
jgi:hypothetical protein